MDGRKRFAAIILLRKGSSAKECRWSLEAQKGKETNSPLEPPHKMRRNTVCLLTP